MHKRPANCSIFSTIMPALTTHALDIFHGRPAAGLRVDLHRLGEKEPILGVVLNADGRPGLALVEGADLVPGGYELVFHVGEYFRARGVAATFFDEVPVRFTVAVGESYHVPLVFSPWAYQTYRGS
jgi:5-hydroxyisourate hydrolase